MKNWVWIKIDKQIKRMLSLTKSYFADELKYTNKKNWLKGNFHWAAYIFMTKYARLDEYTSKEFTGFSLTQLSTFMVHLCFKNVKCKSNKQEIE